MDHRPGLQVTYIRTMETTEHGPVPGGDYKTRWQAVAMACCPWSRLKKGMEKMTVKLSKCLTTVVWRGTQKLEEPCFGIEFQTSYLMRQTGCSCAHKQVMCKHTYLLFHFCFIRGHKWNVSQHSCLNHAHLSTTAVRSGLPWNGNRDYSVWLCEKLWHDCEWLNDFKN